MKEQRLEVNAEGAERLRKLGIVRPGVVLSRIDEYALAHDASGELYFLSSSQLLLGAETSGPMQATLETVEREDCPRLSDYGVLANLTRPQVLELFAAVSPLERVRKATAVTIGRSACVRASTRWGIELAGWVTRYTETGSLAVDMDGDVWVTWPDKTWIFSAGYGHSSKSYDGDLRSEETGYLADIALGLDKDACDRIADHISHKRDGADSLSIVVERELTRIKQGGAPPPCVSVTVAPTAEQKVLARLGCPTDVQSTKDPRDGLFLEIRGESPERLILRTGDDLRVFYPGDQRGPTDTLRAASVLPLSFNVWPVASVTNRHVIEALCESTLVVDRIALARSTAGLSDSQRIASLIFASACGVSADDTYRWIQGARRADNRLPFYAGDFDAIAWHFLQVKQANASPEKLKTAALLRFAHYTRCIGKTITPQEARLWMGDATSLYNDSQVIAQVNDVWKESPPDSLEYSFGTSLVAWDSATSIARVIPVRARAAVAARTWRTDGDHPALVGIVWLPRTVSASDKQEAQNQWRARAADYLHTKRIAAYVPPMMPEIGCLLSEDDLR